MKQLTTTIVFLALLGLSLASCNKEGDIRLGTVIAVVGKNTTGEELSVTIDTMQFKAWNNKYADPYINVGKSIKFTYAYSYSSGDNPVLRFTGRESGKVYLEISLKKQVLKQSYGFFWMDGKNNFNPPAPSAETNKVGFINTALDFPLDVYLRVYKNDWNPATGQAIPVFDEKKPLVENLPKNTWVYKDYIPEGNYTAPYGTQMELILYKSGTKEELHRRQIYGGNRLQGFPIREERGKVKSFYISLGDWDNLDMEVVEKELDAQ